MEALNSLTKELLEKKEMESNRSENPLLLEDVVRKLIKQADDEISELKEIKKLLKDICAGSGISRGGDVLLKRFK